jgi:hypothetical protein
LAKITEKSRNRLTDCLNIILLLTAVTDPKDELLGNLLNHYQSSLSSEVTLKFVLPYFLGGYRL